jgi:hypothetical protein
MKKEDIKLAYKRLKSYVYHENYSLPVLMKIALFEDDKIDDKLSDIYDLLSKCEGGNIESFDLLIKEIKHSTLPKSYSNVENKENGFLYSNENIKEKYLVDRITIFIDCPIEIHIISVLWIMYIGKYLDKELGQHCYGNRLQRNLDDDFEDNSIKLFKKYFTNYSEWRDQGIKKAKELHKLGLDVSILNLDIKNYYNSVDFKSTDIEDKIPKEYLWLNNLIFKVHEHYSKSLLKEKLIEENKIVLPIGLLSSAVLANYYLKNLDNVIINKIKPAYYGRYVDDFIIVFANPILKSKNVLEEFIVDYLISINTDSEKNFLKEENSNGDFSILVAKNKLLFQTKKVKLYHFNKNESINLLEKFENEIIKNSSEFRFEPVSDDILNNFEDSSYKLNYSDTINKFRSVDGISVDKLGVSKHLSKLINATKISNEIDPNIKENLFNQIKDFFSGQRGLELNSLWEKVYNFYTINNAVDEIINFTKEQIKAVLSIDKASNSEIKKAADVDDIKYNLLIHLANCFAMSCSLNNLLFTEKILSKISDLNTNNLNNGILDVLTSVHIKPKSKAIIKSNLLRHNLIYYPLINYCVHPKDVNFMDKKLYNGDFKFDDSKLEYSPRFIHYNELCLFYQFKKILSSSNSVDYEVFINKIFEDYIAFNKLNFDKYEKHFPKSDKFAKTTKTSEGLRIIFESAFPNEKLRIGIVNSKTLLNHSISSMKDKPILNYKRFDEINHILNESLNRQKSDIIIFPEISIPYQWLPHLTSFSKKNNVAIICGLEHISNNKKEVLNYVATILPFKYLNYSNAFVDLRLKKDYSPGEIKEIEGRVGFKVPYAKMKNEKLRLYQWNNNWFSVFNCFELADIRKRAIFRGKVDFVITVEYNRDINYFSNITDSIARDIHAYIIQVNTSEFGDSRITQPSDTITKDILKIKGGDNVSLITGSINIKELRDFQKLNYSLQEGNKNYKFTPPNFNMFERDK